jgi:hypothetical protein
VKFAISLLVTAVTGVAVGLMLGQSTVFLHGTEHHQVVDFSGAVVLAGAAGCLVLCLLWAIFRPRQKQQGQQRNGQSRRSRRQNQPTY